MFSVVYGILLFRWILLCWDFYLLPSQLKNNKNFCFSHPQIIFQPLCVQLCFSCESWARFMRLLIEVKAVGTCSWMHSLLLAAWTNIWGFCHEKYSESQGLGLSCQQWQQKAIYIIMAFGQFSSKILDRKPCEEGICTVIHVSRFQSMSSAAFSSHSTYFTWVTIMPWCGCLPK